jgi:hypothetical protein
MTLAIAAPDLEHTVVGAWRDRLSANQSAKRCHWRTKTVYFRAVTNLLTAAPDTPLTWKSIVDAAQPRGSRSTFYEVAGGHARHSLINALIRDGSMDSIQLALCYQRGDAVAQLIDETKVWSYWPYRERLLTELATGPTTVSGMEAALSRALLAWARRHPSVAEVLGYAPPACAVEDLVLILDGRVAAVRAMTSLADLLCDAALS